MWVLAENVRRNHLLLHVFIALIENICVAERWDSTIFDRECYDRTDKTLNNLPPTVDAVGFQVLDSDFRMILMRSLFESGTKYILYYFASFVTRKTHQTCRETTRSFKHQHKIFCILEMDMDRFRSLVASLGWNVDAILSCSCWLGFFVGHFDDCVVIGVCWVCCPVVESNNRWTQIQHFVNNIMVDVQMTTSSHLLEIGFQKRSMSYPWQVLNQTFRFYLLVVWHFNLPVGRSTDAQKMCVWNEFVKQMFLFLIFLCVFVHKHDFCRGANHKCH